MTLPRSLGTDRVNEDGFGYDLLKLRRDFSLHVIVISQNFSESYFSMDKYTSTLAFV